MKDWDALDLLERTVLERAAVVALGHYVGTPWPGRLRAVPVDDFPLSELLNQPVLVLGQNQGPFLARIASNPKHGKIEVVVGPGSAYGFVHTSSVWVLRIT